ncbi:hypothetical protein KAZ01_01820, partial [Candidatus Gracilibacteria bacterium]|nr:hypothetical protein [Candidatus Gracilibacteria bacterium]
LINFFRNREQTTKNGKLITCEELKLNTVFTFFQNKRNGGHLGGNLLKVGVGTGFVGFFAIFTLLYYSNNKI